VIIADRRPWPARLLSQLDRHPDAFLARCLVPASMLWALAARFKRVLQPDLPLPAAVPSLGIGNLRVGGSGKTPVVEDLGRRLLAEGHRVAVLTRGYGSKGGGDEPGWMRDAGLQVHADKDRSAAFTHAEAAGATRMLLDDALQTRHRPRWTVAIVLDRDLADPPRVLPAGPAREASSALERADFLLVRREATADIALPEAALGFRLEPEDFVDASGLVVDAPTGPALLFSGLARPESFEADAVRAGVVPVASWREPDHWSAGAQVGQSLLEFARTTGAEWILTSEKNLGRLAGLQLQLPLLALRSRIRWDDVQDPLARLRAIGIDI